MPSVGSCANRGRFTGLLQNMCSDTYMALWDMVTGLQYDSECDLKLQGFTDSDWIGCTAGRKSTSKCCFSLGSAVISWCSSKQNSVALSAAEAEYMVVSSAAREAVWLRKLLAELFGQILEPTVIHCDNQSCV